MDQKVHSIERLLFVPYQRHTAFNGQISIGVGLRFCAREFSPSGDKPPPAGAACPIGLLNAHIQKAADFVFRYKVGPSPRSPFAHHAKIGYEQKAGGSRTPP